MSLARSAPRAAQAPLAWLILGLGAGQVVGWGSTYYLPTILGSDISQDLGFSEEMVFAGATLMMLVGAFLAPWVGRSLDRGHARALLTCGCLFAALGIFLIGKASGLASYLFAWLILGVSSGLLLMNSSFVAVAQIAGQAARRAVTFLMLFTGVSSSVAWPVLSALNAAYGWRTTCLMLAAVQLLVCAPLHWMLLPARITPQAPPVAGRPQRQESLPPDRQKLAMRILVPAMCLSGFITWGLSVHLIELLGHLGAGAADAVWLASLLGVLQVSARIIDLAMGERHSPLFTGIVAALLAGLAFVIALSGGAPVAFMIAYGIASGSMSLARVMIPLSLFGGRNFGRASGTVSAFQNVAFAVAPFVYAALFARTGIASALWLSLAEAIVALTGMLALLMLSRA